MLELSPGDEFADLVQSLLLQAALNSGGGSSPALLITIRVNVFSAIGLHCQRVTFYDGFR